MAIARDWALGLRDCYGLDDIASDRDLDDTLDDLQIEVVRLTSLPAGLRDLYAEPLLVLPRGQAQPLDRWAKAHVVGHRILHRGDQLRLARDFVELQECQANHFAWWFLLGDLPHRLRGDRWAIARHVAWLGNVPADCVYRWWGCPVDRPIARAVELRSEWLEPAW